MDNKCIFNPNSLNVNRLPYKSVQAPIISERVPYREQSLLVCDENKDIFVKRPDACEKASGLSGIRRLTNNIRNYIRSYKQNVKHTYDHKLVFALVEKELFGKTSIDSLTHDADKMILYLLGFPKSFVSKYHRTNSVHHTESGKNMNLRSMLCDNIASSPEFKPEKKKSLREHFSTSKELQSVVGFKELLEKYNFGENLDFEKIKAMKAQRYDGFKGIGKVALRILVAFISM
ncbi:hypothetical protein HDR58_06455 [bacterium]|nr:hypothetical protein [bacterium]